MKRLLYMAIIIIFVGSLMLMSYADAEDSQYGRVLYDIGFINKAGISETGFYTNREMALIVGKLLPSEYMKYSLPYKPTFRDVPRDDVAFRAVEFSHALGIIEGKDNKCFGIDDHVSGEQLLLCLAECLGYDSDGSSMETKASDASRQLGLTENIICNLSNDLTRNQAYEMICHVLGCLDKRVDEYSRKTKLEVLVNDDEKERFFYHSMETINRDYRIAMVRMMLSQSQHEQLFRKKYIEWGLGNNLQTYVSNDRDYDWYIDQGDTGRFSSVNCGPSSIAMAGKWLNSSFNVSVEDIRNRYRPDGGYFYDSNITGAFDDYDIDYSWIHISDASDIKKAIDSFNIVVIIANLENVSLTASPKYRTQLYYSYGGKHILIIKGYAEVDDKLYFEVYDPFSNGLKYSDGTLMGKDRYYLANSLMASIKNYYNKAYSVHSETYYDVWFPN